MVSPRKSNSALSFTPGERCRMMPSSTKSCESLYSNASSCKGSSASMLYRRKTPPAAAATSMMAGNGGGGGGSGGGRQATLIPATTEVRQRVLSARRLRMKTYQNQLADAQQTIAELAHENRILRTLHKRQDSALAKYESTNAELPQLLHSHAEELRVWQTKYRNLQAQNKELEQKLKQKEAAILSLSDQNKYFSQLNKDKNLEERQRLTEKLQSLETRLQEKDQDMKLFARKMQLETKNFKQQFLNEQKKTKDVLLRLEKARLELSGYRKLDELNLGEKFGNANARRRPGSSEEQKLEKDLKAELPMLSATEDDSDVQHSQRSAHSQHSTHSHHTTLLGAGTGVGASTRTVRKSNMLTPLQRRVIDRGDGDANSLTMIGDMTQTSTTTSTTSTIVATCTTKLVKQDSSLLYEDDYENVTSSFDDGDTKENIDAQLSDGDSEGAKYATANMQNDSDYVDENDEEQDNDDDDEDNDDDDGDGNDNGNSNNNQVLMNASKKDSTHMKSDITNIRKQITDDYREREAFLDTFCRQATTGAALTRDDVLPPHSNSKPSNIKRNGLNSNIPSNRKNKLLAALKAIDDNKSFD